MNFERQKSDIKKSIGIGQVNNPLTIVRAHIRVGEDGSDEYGELELNNLRAFLNMMEKDSEGKDLKATGWTVGTTMIFETINEITGEHRYKVPLIDLLGKCVRIEFEEEVYRIPANTKV